MKVWITKYALTEGIMVAEAASPSKEMPYLIAVKRYGCMEQYFHKGEWFTDEVSAVLDARSRRAKRIASLRKSIAKLEKLEFSTETV